MARIRIIPLLGRILVFLVLLTSASILLIPTFYHQKAATFLKTQFSRHTDLKLQPFETSISLWEHFPLVTFTFQGLSIEDTSTTRAIQVLGIGQASFTINLSDVWHGNINIQQARLQGVRYTQQIDTLGHKINFHLNPRKTPRKDSTDFWLHIPHIEIEDCQVSNQNDYKQNAFRVHISQATLAAQVAGDSIRLEGNLAGKVDYIKNKKLELLRSKPFTAQAHYTYHLKEKKGSLHPVLVSMNADTLTITGSHTKLSDGTGTTLAIHMSGKQPLMEVLKEVIPVNRQVYLNQIRSASRITLQYELSGESGPMKRPRGKLSFQVNEGELHWPDSNTAISRLRLRGEYDNGEERSAVTNTLTIHQLQAHIGTDSIALQLAIHNFLAPVIKGQFSGGFDLQHLATILHLPYRAHYSGKLVGSVSVNGSVAYGKKNTGRSASAGKDQLKGILNNYLQNKLVWKGNLQLQQGTFRLADIPLTFTGINGKARFRNNLLVIDKTSGKLNGAPFHFSVTIEHLLAYLTGNYPTLQVDGNIYVTSMNSQWFSKPKSTVGKASKKILAKKTPSQAAHIIPSFLQLQLKIACQQLLLSTDTLTNLRLQVKSSKKQIALSPVAFSLRGGNLQGSMYLFNQQKSTIPAQVTLKASFKHLDFRQLAQNYLQPRQTSVNKAAAKQPASNVAQASLPPYLQEMAQAANADISLHARKISLPGSEDLTRVALQVKKKGAQVQIPAISFGTTLGASVKGNGGFQLAGNGVKKPFLRLQFKYNSIDLQQFMKQIASIDDIIPLVKRSSEKKAENASLRKNRKETHTLGEEEFDVYLQVKASRLNYQHLKAEYFTLKARLDNQHARVEEFAMKAFGGWFASRGNITLNRTATGLPVKLRTQIKDVDLKKLFAITDELNLDLLGSEHISGEMDCDLVLHTSLDESFAPDIERSSAYAKVKLRRMELIEVAPIQQAFRFLRKERSRHIYFDDLTTHFLLHDNRFISTGVNLINNIAPFELSGSYQMNGPADFYLDVNVLDVLFSNNKRRIEEIKNKDGQQTNRHKKQHLHITREKDSYHVKLFQQKERESIRQAIHREFHGLLLALKIDTVFSDNQQPKGIARNE
ncbi:AsmA family protein [Rhodocytophaga aerolata]|uniref:AsmA family protein n=1 Tax=Rhodocytophaga aerolata TaxID=455078 RepID=A0ABT8RCG9_9BACT|nr:AsmA-like C-terminal region-containing protein [Rhodocytophaga aerolata]MDO1449396.1 AsmA family protein [Rhodocytophaga aerolata]